MKGLIVSVGEKKSALPPADLRKPALRFTRTAARKSRHLKSAKSTHPETPRTSKPLAHVVKSTIRRFRSQESGAPHQITRIEQARGKSSERNKALDAFDELATLLSPDFEDDKAQLAQQRELDVHWREYELGRELLGTLQGLLLRKQVSMSEWKQIFNDAIQGQWSASGETNARLLPSTQVLSPLPSLAHQGALPPLQGRITSRFGAIRTGGGTHKGLDIAVPVGTSVVASWNGRISRVEENDSFGRFVVVEYSWQDVFGKEPGWFDDSHVEVLYEDIVRLGFLEEYQGRQDKRAWCRFTLYNRHSLCR